jgi:hypothetical protein
VKILVKALVIFFATLLIAALVVLGLPSHAEIPQSHAGPVMAFALAQRGVPAG